MKIELSVLILLGSIALAHATSTLNVHQKDGGIVSYTFSEKPKVIYSQSVIILTTTTTQVEYPLSNLKKITFGSTMPTGVEQVRTICDIVDSTVRIYDINGRLVKAVNGVDGETSFSLGDLGNGIYIVKNGKTTYKVINK